MYVYTRVQLRAQCLRRVYFYDTIAFISSLRSNPFNSFFFYLELFFFTSQS